MRIRYAAFIFFLAVSFISAERGIEKEALAAEPIEKMLVRVLGLYDLNGRAISTVSVGQPTVVRTSLYNSHADAQSFVLVVEIRDGIGVTQFLALHRGIAEGSQSESSNRNEGHVFETPWKPAEFCPEDDPRCSNLYQIRVFALIDSEHPEALSPVFTVSDIALVGSQS